LRLIPTVRDGGTGSRKTTRGGGEVTVKFGAKKARQVTLHDRP
jgi:hypothetical protein